MSSKHNVISHTVKRYKCNSFTIVSDLDLPQTMKAMSDEGLLVFDIKMTVSLFTIDYFRTWNEMYDDEDIPKKGESDVRRLNVGLHMRDLIKDSREEDEATDVHIYLFKVDKVGSIPKVRNAAECIETMHRIITDSGMGISIGIPEVVTRLTNTFAIIKSAGNDTATS